MEKIKIIDAKVVEGDGLWNSIPEFGDYLPDPLSLRIDLASYVEKVRKHGEMFVAKIGGDLAGIIIIYANDFREKQGYCSLLSVHPSFRGCGVGYSLMNHGLEHSRAMGMKTIHLRVLPSNSDAMRFYEKMGFMRSGISEGKILFSKQLSQKI